MARGERVRRIFLVEDCEPILELERAILSRDGFSVAVASSGEEALALLESGPAPDLFLLDVVMPGMDGFTLCRHLKNDRRFAGIPVVFVTAKGGADALREGFSAGCAMYICKPFDAKKLQETVKALADDSAAAPPPSPTTLNLPGHDVAIESTHPVLETLLASVLAELVGATLHDVANALSAASGHLAILEDANTSKAAMALARAMSLTDGLHGLVRSFYRDGQKLAIADAHNLHDHLAEILHLADADAAEAVVHLSAAASGGFAVPVVLLQQLILSPLQNAREATLGMEQSRIRVLVDYMLVERALEIRVDDDGPGWGDALSRLRGIVAGRSGDSYTTKGPGRGRGLRMLSRLVRSLGGAVNLETSDLGGARTRVIVPWGDLRDEGTHQRTLD